MSEQEPGLCLTVDGTEFAMNRLNACLYTFLGEASMYDHVFVITGDDDSGRLTGKYLFSLSSIYPQVKAYMIENQFQACTSQVAPDSFDVEAFDSRYLQDVVDIRTAETVPADWIPQQRQGE